VGHTVGSDANLSLTVVNAPYSIGSNGIAVYTESDTGRLLNTNAKEQAFWMRMYPRSENCSEVNPARGEGAKRDSDVSDRFKIFASLQLPVSGKSPDWAIDVQGVSQRGHQACQVTTITILALASRQFQTARWIARPKRCTSMANPKPTAGVQGAKRAQEAGWPNGKPGNRRKGTVKGTKAGTRRGQLPADKDDHIQRRRARVAQLDLAGHRPAVMLETINQWLEIRAVDARVDPSDYRISMATLGNDRKANLEESTKEAGETSELARRKHVAELQGLWVRAFKDYDNADEDKRPVHLDRLLKIMEMLGKYDGSAVIAARAALEEAGSGSGVNIALININWNDI
jgi:hypothetical protein